MRTKSLVAATLGGALAISAALHVTAQTNDRSEPPARGEETGERPPPPDLTDAAATLGISSDDLHAALRASGGPPPNLAKAAETLGISEEDLKAALPERPRRPRR